jgi:hypothetical protein
MARFILRYGGDGAAPSEHVRGIAATSGIRIIDQSSKMLLVDGNESALQEKVRGMAGWSVHPEQQYPLPDTRHTIK